MRQGICIAIMMIAVGPLAWADSSTSFENEQTWYQCSMCFVVRMIGTTPCPVCRTDTATVVFTPTDWELCPVCGSADVETRNPRGAHLCQMCGIVFRHPQPRTLADRLHAHGAAFSAWRAEYVHGFLESRNFLSHEDRGTRAEGRLQLSFARAFTDTVEYAVTLDIRGDTDNLAYGVPETLDPAHRTVVGLSDARLLWRGERLDLTVGAFTLPWGRADRVNPTDPTPRDYTDLLNNEKLAMAGVRTQYSWGVASSVDIVCFPWATPSVFPAPASEWFLSPFDLTHRDEFLRDLRNERGVGYGTRFSSTLAMVDWSLSWFDGIETAPSLRMGLPPRLVYNSYRVVGVDFETTLRGLGLRGEVAWRTHDSGHGDATVRSIVGIDYGWQDIVRDRDTFRAFLSYARDDVRQEGTDIEYPYPFTNSLVGKIEYEYDEETRASLSVVATIDRGSGRIPAVRGGDWYLQPEIRHTISGWELTIGADIFEGPQDSFFGFFGDNDRLVIGLKKEF